MAFEDLDVWKRSAGLSADIYKVLSDLKDYGFKDQITRSGLSIPSNIAEGLERRSDKEKNSISVICKRIVWRAKNTDLHRYENSLYLQKRRQ